MSPEVDRSQLFSLRVWKVEVADGIDEHRGQIRHVLSGETRHFRDWNTLIDFVVEQMEIQNGSATE